MDYQTILTEVTKGVATITLNRPERLNAWTWRMGAELRHAIAAYEVRDDIHVIVVTGAGRTFCAGADLESGKETFAGDRRDELRRLQDELHPATEKQPHEMNTPIIAAMNGSAVGVGMTMVMEYDIRIAAEDAKYGFVFNRRGVIPEINSLWLVPRLIGVSRGLELLLTGRLLRGREGADMGLFSAAVPAPEVLPHALEIARDIATNVAPVSAAIVKRHVYECLEQTDRAAAKHKGDALFLWVAQQPDAMEGPVAFLQKRDPQWKLSKNADFPEDQFKA
jgi:enoyl-CoA hydratase/carnithine racemase